jgi:hypothetical protein
MTELVTGQVPAWLGESAPAPLPGPDQLAVLIDDAARRAAAILGATRQASAAYAAAMRAKRAR